MRIDGNEQINTLLQNGDGSYAGAGMHDGKAMLVLPLATGKTGCQDTATNATYNAVSNVSESYTPYYNEGKTPVNTLISLGMQTITPVEEVLGCHDFDSCYKISGSPLLCGNAEEVFSQMPVDTINNCSDNEFFAISKGTALYNAYRDSLKGSFEQDYINMALKAAELENFTVHYTTSEYHYTLYYYDQAGNLVKTVPPAGAVVNRSETWLNDVKAKRAAGVLLRAPHTMTTEYRYNTLNQMISQKTPDAGISHFWYDRLGRLAISQNAKQAAASPKRYSYTLYDAIGRITEVGEISSATAMTDIISRDEDALANWIETAAGNKSQVTVTAYDVPHSPLEGVIWNPTNLRNRVSWTGFYNTAADLESGTARASGTFYSYDILGNVGMLLQDYHLGPQRDNVNRYKKIVYDYDLISGKVNKVSYQPGYKDQFFHRYSYDAENRLTNAQTSVDGIYWENDAYYQYYKHGPLARMVLGQQQVQGVDYAYTLQGWLKGVNSTTLTPAFDMGNDGATGGITARDAFGFALHYFGERDYRPVNPNVHPFVDAESAGSRFKPLFNGNIGMMSVNLPKVGEPLLYAYGYDVLNRLVKMDAARNLNTTTNNWDPVSLDDYQESVSYDPNGNILTYNRNGNPTVSGKPADMDRLTYSYIPNTNQLDHIVDAGNTQYENDIKSQGYGNYGYDLIGNMTKDVGANIGTNGIEWTVYGKIKKIVKTDPSTSTTTTITYDYDPAGNRISKSINGKVTRYVRDASGNVMSVYVYDDPAVNSGRLSQTEVDLYGSSRLGISSRVTDVENSLQLPVASIGGLESTSNVNFVRDQKFFELSNHLGNVLATVSDVKKARSDNGSTIDHFDADLVSAQDYYPFGMLVPGRNWNIGGYRYGFNGKENDNEVKGDGNQQDYGMRIYDSRVGRFLSVDPITKDYPGLTPYQFASNRPIDGIDLDGLEFYKNSIYHYRGKSFSTLNFNDVWISNMNTHEIAMNSNPGPMNEGQAPSDLDINDEGTQTEKEVSLLRPKQGTLGDWAKIQHNKLSGGGSDPVDKHNALGAVDAVTFLRDVTMTAYSAYYNVKYSKEIQEAANSAVAFDKAFSLVAAADKNGVFPSDMPAEIKTDILNWLVDGENIRGKGDPDRGSLVNAWGSLLFNNQQAANNGTLIAAPKALQSRFVDPHSESTVVKPPAVLLRTTNPASQNALDAWDRYKRSHPDLKTLSSVQQSN